MMAVSPTVELAKRSSKQRLDPLIEEEEEGIWLSANGELLERAIANLLANAIKYSEPGGRVTLALDTSTNGTVFTVADQGAGIPETERLEVATKDYRLAIAEQGYDPARIERVPQQWN